VNNLKITEGPWRAELVDEFNRQPYYAIMQAEGVIRSRIGTVDIAIDDNGWERPSSKANARAVASLPALIEALEDARKAISNAIEVVGSRKGDPEFATLAKVEAALAKARGEL
jgi:hypothetical protein